MPKLVRAATRQVRSRVFDSARWQDYRPRPDDIIIATYPKCGTTWTQRIVCMLIFGCPKPRPIWALSPWPDMRWWGPVEPILAKAEAQTHRRFFKSHLPYDALPVYEGVKFIHVARDGRDAAISFHNHLLNMSPEAREMGNAVIRSDPKFGDEIPPIPECPQAFFREWITDDGRGDDGASFFTVERSFWEARHEEHVLLVHFNDLLADLGVEMRRIAMFLDIEIPELLWPKLIEAAGFEAMKSQGDALLPEAHRLWDGGPARFLNRGTNGRWQNRVAPEDLARYEARVREAFSPGLARWLEHGRLVAGDPRGL